MMTALLMVVVIALAALAVDLGMQRVVRSDMQALADVVALDAARLLDGRDAQRIRAGDDEHLALETAVEDSVTRNASTLGDVDQIEATLVFLDPGPNGEWVPRRQSIGGPLVPVPDDQVPDAVLVTADGSVDFAFAAGRGAASRAAIASSESAACFRLGSFALGVKSADSPLLERFLGDILNVGGVTYAGLARVGIELPGLAAELGVGTADGLMEQTNITLGELYLASARALSNQGGPVAAVNVLQRLGAGVSSTKQIDLADIFALSTGGAAGLAGEVDALDLVMASAFMANGDAFLETGVTWNAPFLHPDPDQRKATIKIVEVPRLACGRVGEAEARTGQFSLHTELPMNLNNASVGYSGLLPVGGSTPVKIEAVVGGARGTLIDLRCGVPSEDSPDGIRVRVDRTNVSVAVAGTVQLKGRIDLASVTRGLSSLLDLLGVSSLLQLLDPPKIEVDLAVRLGAQLTGPGTSESPWVINDALPYARSETTGGGAVTLPAPIVTSANIVAGSVAVVSGSRRAELNLSELKIDPILDAVRSRWNPSMTILIGNVNSFLTPLSSMLGLTLTGADVFAIPRPNCGVPALVG